MAIGILEINASVVADLCDVLSSKTYYDHLIKSMLSIFFIIYRLLFHICLLLTYVLDFFIYVCC